MSDFVSLDLHHERAVICHIRTFRLAIEYLGEYVPDRKREFIIDQILQEANDFINFLGEEEVDEIIEQVEASLDEIDNLTS